MAGDESPKYISGIRSPIRNLNIVLNVCQPDEPHTDKQFPTQRFFFPPFGKYSTFLLSNILRLLLLEAGKEYFYFTLSLDNYYLLMNSKVKLPLLW